MTVFTYSRVPAFNPNTSPVSVARSASGSVYDLGDTGFLTPLNLTLVATNTVTTSLISDANGMFPDFTLVDRTSVAFKSGSQIFVLTTTTPIPGPTGPASTVPGPAGPATTDASLLTAGTVADARLPARLSDASLSATYVPKWKATTAYLAGDTALSPAGETVTAKVNFTSGASYSPADWNASKVYPRIRQLTDPQFKGSVPLMTSPPTVAVTNNSLDTTVANAQTLPGQSYTSILCDDFNSYLPLGVGTAPAVRGTVSEQAYACNWPGIGSTGTDTLVRPEFLFDGTVFEFLIKQFGGVQYRIMVDGAYVTQYPQSLGGTAGQYGLVKVTFATRAVRRITLELILVGTGAFFGVSYQKGDTMRATAAPNRRLVIAGDSYAGGSESSGIGTFVPYLAQALGFRDFINAGIGSTGWLANGSYTNIATRLQTDVVAHNPTDVIIALGSNDTGSSNAAITTQVQTVLASIRSSLPNLRSLVVTGAFFAGGTPGVYTAMNTAIQSGAGAADAFIDTGVNPIFTGTGKTGSRVVTDGVTNSTTTITSATAAFVGSDVGCIVTGSGIPAYATIASVTNSTTAVLSAAATATASGVTLTITNQKNNGNSDYYIATDGTHPTDPGSVWQGFVIGQAIASTLP